LIPIALHWGVDSHYDQLCKTSIDEAYRVTGVEGFIPWNSFKCFKFNTVTSHTPGIIVEAAVKPLPRCSSLAKLNVELCDWKEDKIEAVVYLNPTSHPSMSYS
jgi:hypothetical protein